MVLIPINGIEIDFPYPPYGAQIRYMSSVIDALRSGDNALLESPTGTGKTLCLLCATLAWRATYVAALQAHVRPTQTAHTSALLSKAGLRPIQGAASALSVLIRPDANTHLSAPRIIFSSRTHSQLAQAVSELKKTVYRPAMSILASRDQLCLHDIASNLSGSRLNAMCRRVTNPTRRQCRFHLPVASNRPHENRCSELVDKMQAEPPMDIEDLRHFGTNQSACPWFLSRAAARSDACEILFLPYNYLLDRSARGSLDIDWSNDIVIIDEAHNLESMCSNAMSFDLTSSMRVACDAELSKLIEHAVRPGGLNIPALENLAKTDEGLDSVIGSENRDLLEIRLMRSILVSLEEFISAVAFDRGKESDISFRVFPGYHFRGLLEAAGGPTCESYELFLEMLDRAMGVQAEKVKLPASGEAVDQGGTGQSSGNSAIRILQTAIRVLFESVAGGNEKGFRTVVQQSTSKPNAGRTISYWCFNPAISMKSITHLNLRSLLLTSGTLSPMDSFAAELGIPFAVRLENPHVVTKPQVWAGVLKAGPDVAGVKGGRLTSAYYARGEGSSIELGRAMIRIASVVPDGLLVFYPSYGSLFSCIDVWKKMGPGADKAKPSIWEHLLRYKRIVAEERESSKFAAAILAHRANVDARAGSILLAVCRGKVSEGIDFSDEYGRAVVITGLPYPSAFDPKVVLKREYCDEEAKNSKGSKKICEGGRRNLRVLSGSEWYTIQALRAVNQAVGRAIRHRYDYGAIMLCDDRFQSKHLQDQISKWIRPSLNVCHTFSVAETSLQGFFFNAVSSQFAKEGEKSRLEAKKRQTQVDSKRKESSEAMNAVLVAQQAITSFLPPQKTEKQFLEQVLKFTDELKGQHVNRVVSSPKRSVENEHVKVLDFSSQIVRGGLNDSGCLRSTKPDEVCVASAPKRSAKFLAARAVQMNSEEGDKVEGRLSAGKRLRMTREEGGSKATEAINGDKKEKFSDKIKRIFSRRTDQREFLRLFRDVISLNTRMREGVGPLQTKMEQKQNMELAKVAVHAIVDFIVRNAENSELAQGLIQDLRSKIPSGFRTWYDAAIKK